MMAANSKSANFVSYLSLFTSLGTLLCCALPSLLVLFGLGAAVAGALSAMPWLVALSRHKIWVFAIAGALIVAGFVELLVVAPRLQAKACAIDDPSCARAARIAKTLLWISAGVYAVGFFTAFILGPILAKLDQA